MDATPPAHSPRDLARDPRPARRRVAVVLFNLGGPDRPESIRPFLVNLFSDPAILRVPGFVRPLLARIIARARLKPATENYAILGGRSPLLELTEDQARALEAALARHAEADGIEARCFVAMRYWHPFADQAVCEVRDWGADEVVLMPLYPQFSTTTTGSSVVDWVERARRGGLDLPTTTLCCWHSDPAFAEATAAILRRSLERARAELPAGKRLRVLFSAHGLPETIVRQGDPYQWQVERTVAAVLEALGEPGLDYAVCYQSRATPQKWIGPSTEVEIARAAGDGVALLVNPIAFVSEHSETLVELDVEYRELAEKEGVHGYFRVPTQNDDPAFVDAMAGLVRRARADGRPLCSFGGGRQCPKAHGDCPHAALAAGREPGTAARVSA